MSEAIKANIMQGDNIPNEHKFEIALKKPVLTNESDTTHFLPHIWMFFSQQRATILGLFWDDKSETKVKYFESKEDWIPSELYGYIHCQDQSQQ